MKNYIRSALDTLIALDFQLDHEDRKLRSDRWILTHANAPEDRLTLNFKMSEQAARTAVQRAKQIVGLASVGAEKRKPKASHRQKMERAAERKRVEAARALADAKEAAERTRRIEAQAARNHRDLDRLLRGRELGPTDSDIPSDAMLTVEQVADSTGVNDIVVQRAIANGKLEAYQCGKDVKVKSADVREWLAAS